MVLLSYLHEDHFDRRVERLLNPVTPIITTPTAAHALTQKGFQRTTGLSTWQDAETYEFDAQTHKGVSV